MEDGQTVHTCTFGRSHHLLPEGMRQASDGDLAGHIRTMERRRTGSHDRGIVDENTCLLPAKLGQSCTRSIDRAHEVDLKHTLKRRGGAAWAQAPARTCFCIPSWRLRQPASYRPLRSTRLS